MRIIEESKLKKNISQLNNYKKANKLVKDYYNNLDSLKLTSLQSLSYDQDIAFFDETEDEVTARVTVNWHAMRHWALQYCRHICILAPTDLAEQVQEDLSGALTNYRMMNG